MKCSQSLTGRKEQERKAETDTRNIFSTLRDLNDKSHHIGHNENRLQLVIVMSSDDSPVSGTATIILMINTIKLDFLSSQ